MPAPARALFARGTACAAATVLLGGLVGAPLAFAAPSSSTTAALESVASAPLLQAGVANTASVDAVFKDYAATFGVAKLQSVMVNGEGRIVIRTGDPVSNGAARFARSFTAPAQPSVNDFAAKYGNVVVESASGPASGFASDLTNGQGIVALNDDLTAGGTCSIGWNGFNKTGQPAVITAGHCTGDDLLTQVLLSDPEQDPATTADPKSGRLLGPLGTFGFSQFGGPGNTPTSPLADWDGQDNTLSNIGTDVAVVDNIDAGLNQLPKVTDWTTPAEPKASGPVVTGVSNAVVGAEVCKSGRTSGWDCGTVSGIGVFLVRGTTYPTTKDACDAKPAPTGCDDVRAVRGFGSPDLISIPGDSGGAIVSGTLAVGMVSAGVEDEITYGVSLTDALGHTDGYSVKIFLAAPKVTTTAPVYREGTIAGTVAGAPAGSKVVVTLDGVTSEVAVGNDGKWSIKAPRKFGTFSLTAHTKNGFSISETTTASVEVIKETLPAPAITSPANNAKLGSVTGLSGTGKPGATINLTGDIAGSVKVNADGTWRFGLEPGLDLGPYTVTAQQSLTDWNDSAAVTVTFTVAPQGPAITTPANAQKFAFDQGPTVISGTNQAGATVRLTLNGTAHEADVVDGTWSVTLPNKLTTGTYTITAVQNLDGLDSLVSTSSFSVLAAPKPEPTVPPVTQKPTQAPGQVPPSSTPASAPTPTPGNGALAATGATTGAYAAGGALLLLAGAGTMVVLRRRSH